MYVWYQQAHSLAWLQYSYKCFWWYFGKWFNKIGTDHQSMEEKDNNITIWDTFGSGNFVPNYTVHMKLQTSSHCRMTHNPWTRWQVSRKTGFWISSCTLTTLSSFFNWFTTVLDMIPMDDVITGTIKASF